MELIYSLFENYGIWVLLIITFFAQLGLPIGSTFFLMWYGSTIDSSSSLLVAILATSSAAIVGDMTAFSLGRQFSTQLNKAEEQYSWLAKRINQSQKLLDSYGVLLIWVTRFLVTGLGPVVNYLLGSRKYSAIKFFQWIIFGEIIFATEMVYFGFYFKQTWEDLLAVIADTGWLIALVAISIWIIKTLIKRNKYA